ncbi:hypothetical protein JCM14076_10610 [Methylosoma difficile]
MKNSFYLVIPKPINDPDRLKEFTPKALEQWIAELPIANMEMSARLMQDFIMTFNTLKMPAQFRLEALEVLRPSLIIIEDYLRSQLLKSGFPKSESDKGVLTLLVALQREFTISYWIALKEYAEQVIGWFQGQNAALAVQRCIKGLSSIVISHFIMGRAVPDWVWIDLHSLYKLSVKIKKDLLKVPNDPGEVNKSSSAKECYMQILLTSLADPQGLVQNEILLVYRFVETLLPLLDIKGKAVSGNSVNCTIMVDEDKPPFFWPADEELDSDSALLYLDLAKFFQACRLGFVPINEVNARFNALNAAQNDLDKPSSELLEYLVQRWQGEEIKSSPLFKDRLDRYVAIGLTATAGLQKMTDTTPAPNLEILAHSASENMLSCVFKKTGILSVGSLVSFRKPDVPKGKRILAVVDRLVVAKEIGRINFGLQFLANQFSAITYLPGDADNMSAAKKALFYSSSEQEVKSYLIIDTLVLKEGDIIWLFFHQERARVFLQNRKNIGLGYWRFECKKVVDSR